MESPVLLSLALPGRIRGNSCRSIEVLKKPNHHNYSRPKMYNYIILHVFKYFHSEPFFAKKVMKQENGLIRTKCLRMTPGVMVPWHNHVIRFSAILSFGQIINLPSRIKCKSDHFNSKISIVSPALWRPRSPFSPSLPTVSLPKIFAAARLILIERW